MGMGGVGIISLSPYERRPHQLLPLFNENPRRGVLRKWAFGVWGFSETAKHRPA